jgi:hypothetical protein
MPPTLAALHQEITQGCPSQAARWLEATRQLRYWQKRGADLVKQRPEEAADDFEYRPKVATLFVHQVISELAKGLYSPGPSRDLKGSGEARTAYDQILQQNGGNATFVVADQMAWLHGVYALQVSPTGNPDMPIRLDPWRADEFAVWLDDDDPRTPWAVLVRSVFEGRRQVRYQVWSADEVRTYWTEVGDVDPLGRGVGRTLKMDQSASVPHKLGCLPFVFIHNEPPVVEFWTPGLGQALADTEANMNMQASDLAQSVQAHCIPRMYAENVAQLSRLHHRAGDLLELQRQEQLQEAKIFAVQPDLQVEEVWAHIHNLGDQALTALGLPMTVSPRERAYAESGVALSIRRQPMLDLWKARQEVWKPAEERLAQIILQVRGAFYGSHTHPDGVTLTLSYPEPRQPLPSPERNEADTWELEQGLTSRTRILMERKGLTREQAIEWQKQTLEDLKQEEALYQAAGLETPTEKKQAAQDDLGDDKDPDQEIPGE